MADLPRFALKQFAFSAKKQKRTFHYFKACSLLSKRAPEEIAEFSEEECSERELVECRHCAKAISWHENPTQQKCPDCQRLLPLDNFHRNKNSRSGRGGYCKDCKKISYKDWSDGNLNRKAVLFRAWNLRKYGMTPEDYDVLFKHQNGRCASCGRKAEEFHHGLAVDHDHEHGFVRGLLCGNCNRALGVLGDSSEGVENLLNYIRSYEEKLWFDHNIDLPEFGQGTGRIGITLATR